MVSWMLLSPEIGRLVRSDGEPWSLEEIVLAVRGDKAAARDALAELRRKTVVSVDERDVYYCRKLVRQERSKRATRERVGRHRTRKRDCNGRCNAIVTPIVTVGEKQAGLCIRSDPSVSLFEDPIQERPLNANTKAIQAEKLYQAYPRKVGKKAAIKAILWALKGREFETLMAAVLEFAASPKARGQYCPHPATWFNEGRWEDDRRDWQHGGTKNASDQLRAELERGRNFVR
jgi:hypothetical protein